MTIVLLSKSSNTLYGIRISEYFSFLTTRLEHPTLPVLLTKSGPLRDYIQCDTSRKKVLHHTHLKFKNRLRLFQSHERLSFALPNVLATLCSYPKGNFKGNQLLESSISLSPLCLYPTNDLHVSIATGIHRNFS